MNCPYTWKIRLVFHHSPFTIHHSPFTIHHSPFTIHHSPFTIHHSLLHGIPELDAPHLAVCQLELGHHAVFPLVRQGEVGTESTLHSHQLLHLLGLVRPLDLHCH